MTSPLQTPTFHHLNRSIWLACGAQFLIMLYFMLKEYFILLRSKHFHKCSVNSDFFSVLSLQFWEFDKFFCVTIWNIYTKTMTLNRIKYIFSWQKSTGTDFSILYSWIVLPEFRFGYITGFIIPMNSLYDYFRAKYDILHLSHSIFNPCFPSLFSLSGIIQTFG
jgi:hypothetical protein